MNIFRLNDSLKTYTYSIIKIFICVALIPVIINRVHIFHYVIENEVVDFIESLLCAAIGIACIFCIYISAAEMIVTSENRAKERALSDSIIAKSKNYAVDEIVSMAEANDIIEIQIVSANRAVKIGSSSDCEIGSSKFFDKQYYIGEETFESIDDFKSKLLAYAINGQISVALIDDLAPKYYRNHT